MNVLTIANAIHKRASKRTSDEEDAWTPQQWKEIYERQVQSELYNLEQACKLVPRIEAILDKYNIRKTKEKITGNWFWITLRPSDEHRNRFKDFRYICERDYIPRKMFLNGSYCWEQKGETIDDIGKGYHLHMLINCRTGLMKPQVIKDTKSTFKKFFNGDVPDAFVQVDYVRTEADYNRMDMYMDGAKTDDWKDPACAMDIPWRESLGLISRYQVQAAER